MRPSPRSTADSPSEALRAAGYQHDAERNIWSRERIEPFAYSDGDEVEARIREAIASCSDRSVFSDELLPHKKDWASHYHLSALRANLLRPLESSLRGEVLELGCGCGALTRYLGSVAARVVGVEGSARRAGIAALRCADQANVSVVCDRFQDLALPDASFDAVTLVGVLEYARLFDREPGAVGRALECARRFLRPAGILVVAIENQLGLKYFAGVGEDHLGQPMLGINDAYPCDSVVTMSRRELEQQLLGAGFARVELHVPIPDYKLPISVLHPASFESGGEPFDVGELLVNGVEADQSSRAAVLFSLERAWPLVARAGLARDLANSFLFVAFRDAGTRSPVEPGVLASHFGAAFRGAYAKQTRFVRDGEGIRVVRAPLAKDRTLAGDEAFTQSYEDETYVHGVSVFARLVEVLNRDGWTTTAIADVLAPWFEWLRRSASVGSGPGNANLPACFLDATLTNVLDVRGELTFIDREWRGPPGGVGLDLVAYRGLLLSLNRLNNVAPPLAGTPLAIGPLTRAILRQAGVDFDDARAGEMWEEMGRLHRQVFGAPWPAFECIGARNLTVRQDVRALWQSAQEVVETRRGLGEELAGLRAMVAQHEPLVASLRSELVEAQAQLERARAEFRTAAEGIAWQGAELRRLTTSRSWRLTEPMRRAAGWVRRWRRA